MYSCSSSSLLVTFSKQNKLFFETIILLKEYFWEHNLIYNWFLEFFILVGDCILACNSFCGFLSCSFRINMLMHITVSSDFQRYLSIFGWTKHRLILFWNKSLSAPLKGPVFVFSLEPPSAEMCRLCGCQSQCVNRLWNTTFWNMSIEEFRAQLEPKLQNSFLIKHS